MLIRGGCGNLQYGETPLHEAAKSGHVDVVRMLVDRDAFKEASTNVRAPQQRPRRDVLRACMAQSGALIH